MEGQKTAMDKQADYMRDALAETTKAADSAESSAKTATASLEISQRAMVVIDLIRLDQNLMKLPVPQPPEHYLTHLFSSRPEVLIKNEGNTEALNCQLTINATLSNGGDIPVTANATVTRPTVLPRGKGIVETLPQIARLFPAFEPSEIVGFLERGWLLSISGIIRYRDVFDKGWYVSFSSILDTDVFQFRTTMGIWEDGRQPPES